MPSAKGLTHARLHDHVPTILDRLADAIERRDEGARPLEDLPEQHAILRFQDGYDLRQVVAEYRLLRHVITEMYAEHGDLSPGARAKITPLTVMHETVDRAISEARARACDVMQLSVWSGNLGAQRFYQRYGFAHVADIDFWVGNHRDDEFLYELTL